MSLTSEIGVIFLLVFLNGFFAMSELAIVSARRVRLKQMIENGHSGAKLALALAEDPASFLSIVQIGMTVNSVLAGAFGGATLAPRFAEYIKVAIPSVGSHSEVVALTITVLAVTYLNLVLGELLPKRIGLSYAEPIATHIAFSMHFFSRIAAPIVWVLKQSTEVLLRTLHLATTRDETVTEEEVKDLIAEGAESGVFKPAERTMLEGVMRLADRTVRTIMTPRLDMVWLGSEDPPEEHKKVIRSSGYSRFPVARGDLEEIIGIVYAKDILNAGFDGQPFALKSIMRPALIVQDTTTVLRLLEQFKHVGQHIALIVDEYGSVEGLVSVTDILEAVMGDLPEPGQESTDAAVLRDDGSWILDGMKPIDEVGTLIGLKNMRDDGDDFHTLAGFFIHHIGRLPIAGDHFTWEGARFEVVTMDSRRIDKVLIYPPLSLDTTANLQP